MIYPPSEPRTRRGTRSNREIIVALLAMAFVMAVMLRYTQVLWCDRLPAFCLPARPAPIEEPARASLDERPENAATARPGRSRGDAGAIPAPLDAIDPDPLAPLPFASATETSRFPDPTRVAFPTPLAFPTQPAPIEIPSTPTELSIFVEPSATPAAGASSSQSTPTQAAPDTGTAEASPTSSAAYPGGASPSRTPSPTSSAAYP